MGAVAVRGGSLVAWYFKEELKEFGVVSVAGIDVEHLSLVSWSRYKPGLVRVYGSAPSEEGSAGWCVVLEEF